jgi:hypothetical protein
VCQGLVDFSRPAHNSVAQFNEIVQKSDFASIEMLEGLLIFPDSLAKLPLDSRTSCTNTAFPLQSKCLTHSATEQNAVFGDQA